jgi:hypothetical protein
MSARAPVIVVDVAEHVSNGISVVVGVREIRLATADLPPSLHPCSLT